MCNTLLFLCGYFEQGQRKLKYISPKIQIWRCKWKTGPGFSSWNFWTDVVTISHLEKNKIKYRSPLYIHTLKKKEKKCSFVQRCEGKIVIEKIIIAIISFVLELWWLKLFLCGQGAAMKRNTSEIRNRRPAHTPTRRPFRLNKSFKIKNPPVIKSRKNKNNNRVDERAVTKELSAFFSTT